MGRGNIIKTCDVNGVITQEGHYAGICGKSIVGSGSQCGAHGNTKCKHLIKTKRK